MSAACQKYYFVMYSLSNLVALLRLNLFIYRDLWEWIEWLIDPPPLVKEAEQLALSLV